MLTLPFAPGIPAYSMDVSIDDNVYVFDVRWSATAASWFFDLREIDRTPILLGQRVVLGAYLGRRSTHPLFLNGVIVARDTSGQQREAGFYDIGRRVDVRYLRNEEIDPAVFAMRRDVARSGA